MANSFVTYTGNGSTQTFTVTFPYLAKSHVKVYVDGVEDTTFTWPTTSTVTLTSVPANGTTVVVKRVTPTTPLVDFIDGSNITEEILDTANLQAIYLTEETRDDVGTVFGLDTNDNKWDAEAKVIKNVADPVNDQDAATKKWVNDTYTAGVAGVSTFNGRTGVVTLSSSDVAGALGYTPATTSHNHSGTYEPADSTILKEADIGSIVQGYDAATAKLGLAQTWAATQVPDNGTASVSTTSTYTFNGGDQVREITLTNAITVAFGAPTGITQYAMYQLILKAGDTSARTFAWNSAYKFPGATPPVTSGTTTSGAFDVLTFIGGASNTLIFVGSQADVR